MSSRVKQLREEFERLNALNVSISNSYHSDKENSVESRELSVSLKSVPSNVKEDDENSIVFEDAVSSISSTVETSSKSFKPFITAESNDENIETNKSFELEEEITNLRRKLMKKSNLVRHLKDEIDEYKFKDDDEAEQMRKTVDEFQRELNKQKKHKKHMNEQRSSLTLENNAMRQELDMQNQEIKELNEKISQNDELHTQKLSKSHLELQKSMNEIKHYEKSNALLTKENEKLNIEITALRQYSRDTENELNQITLRLQSSQKRLISFETKESSMNQKKRNLINKLSALQRKYDDLHKMAVQKDVELNELSSKSESAERKSRTSMVILRETVENQQKDRAEIENMQSNFEKYKQTMEAKVTSLQQKLSMTEQSENECKQKVVELEELLVYKNRVNDELQQQAMEKMDALKEIEREYDHLSVEHKHLKSEYKHSERSRSRTRSSSYISSDDYSESGKMKDEIYHLKRALSKSESRCDELEYHAKSWDVERHSNRMRRQSNPSQIEH